MWVQPLILEGARLEAYVRAGFEYLFHVFGDRRALRFKVGLPARAESTAVAAENAAKAISASPVASADNDHAQNGNASL